MTGAGFQPTVNGGFIAPDEDTVVKYKLKYIGIFQLYDTISSISKEKSIQI